jgi:hypothetical protein
MGASSVRQPDGNLDFDPKPVSDVYEPAHAVTAAIIVLDPVQILEPKMGADPWRFVSKSCRPILQVSNVNAARE